MAQLGISITKRCEFRNGVQEFSNTYHYFNEIGGGLEEEANAIIDAIVDIEKQLHSGAVSFDRARAWTAGGTIDENVTVVMRDLSGTGTATVSGSEDPERSLLVKWYNGRDSLGRRKYLKKWFHGLTSSFSLGTADVVSQNGTIPQSSRAAIKALVDGLTNVGDGLNNEWELCSPSGDVHEGEAEIYPWLEHHQFGDQWRTG